MELGGPACAVFGSTCREACLRKCVCMYGQIMHACIHTWTDKDASTRMHACMHACMHAMQPYMHTYIHTF